ncbi:hypothetical protein MOC31_17235, partial [Bacillus inaquosorum]|nr:hypothetical protein [Bacillus inaquosorum]
DVITAQHWMTGRELKPKDMSGRPVAELLRKIHTSKALLDMLKRLGKEPLNPGALATLEIVEEDARAELEYGIIGRPERKYYL